MHDITVHLNNHKRWHSYGNGEKLHGNKTKRSFLHEKVEPWYRKVRSVKIHRIREKVSVQSPNKIIYFC